ncbi:response regulator transcription factor [Streptacidiphilus sp. N1-12]|uniref:Response regulator transcription factor n=2 Tax=Streptacidiphilus alkalitolerans TaxID=3342712 RepID=A0ABV6WQ27_9ACTN
MASVLVVEDDPGIRAELIDVLTGNGHAVRSAADGFGGLREVTRGPLDAVILDLGLPDLDGSDALRMIRGISQVPVLIVTARDEDAEIIRLLNAGADDYLVKPFSAGQLLARLAAVLRRSGRGSDPSATPASLQDGPPLLREPVSIGPLRIDPGSRTAYLRGQEVPLTRREFDLLSFLAANADLVVSKRRILAEVWREPYVEDQTIDVHLSSLRRKLGESAAAPGLLRTMRGVGIKLVTPR